MSSSFHRVDRRSRSANSTRSSPCIISVHLREPLEDLVSVQRSMENESTSCREFAAVCFVAFFNMPPRDLGLLTNAFYVFLYAPFLRVGRWFLRFGKEANLLTLICLPRSSEPESRARFLSSTSSTSSLFLRARSIKTHALFPKTCPIRRIDAVVSVEIMVAASIGAGNRCANVESISLRHVSRCTFDFLLFHLRLRR